MESFLAWLIESSLFVLMIFGIRKVFSGRISYAGIYALWLVVLLRFIMPVNFISAPVSISSLVTQTLASREDAAELPVPETMDLMTGERVLRTEGTVTPMADGSSSKTGQDSMKSGAEPDGAGLTADALSGIQQAAPELSRQETVQTGTLHREHRDWMPMLKRVWVIVLLPLFLWIFLSNIRLLRKIKQGRILYGRRGSVRIYISREIENPCLYGFLRPSIYVPAHLVPAAGAGRKELDEWEQIITHEYVHYCHRDHIWGILRIILVSVYWYHPFVWMAAAASKKDAELFCDETVIRILGEEQRFSYGEMLIRLAGDRTWGDFRYSMMSMSHRGKEMARRIRAIGIRKRYSQLAIIPLAAVLILSVGVTGSAGFVSITGGGGQSEKADEDSAASGAAIEEEGAGAVEGLISANEAFPKNVQGSMFYTNPYIGKTLQNGKTVMPGLQQETAGYMVNNSAYDHLLYYRGGRTFAGSPEEAFNNYIQIFTEAVNTGNTDKLNQVLSVDYPVYEQQCDLVRNYYKRGIHEELKSYDILSVEENLSVEESADAKGTETDRASSGQIVVTEVCSKEKIDVSYADGTTKRIKQKYRYTCKEFGGGWMIIGMEAI